MQYEQENVTAMYSVTVSDHIMIAHSLRGEVFGPAQQMHGATYVVEVEFRSQHLDPDGIVIDIGLAGDLLREVLQPLNYRNLDESPEFQGVNTTTEVLPSAIFSHLLARLQASGRVKMGPDGLQAMKVTLRETPSAWAAYEAALA